MFLPEDVIHTFFHSLANLAAQSLDLKAITIFSDINSRAAQV